MIFDVIVVLVAVAAIGLVARRADARVDAATKRMEQATAGREAAIYKQAKVFVQRLEASRRAGEKALDDSRNAVADARQLQDKIGKLMEHPTVRRMLRGD